MPATTQYEIAKPMAVAIPARPPRFPIETAKGTLTSAKGKYLGAEAQVNYTEIRSPINGVVTDRPLFAGETASAGAPLVTVMDTSGLIAKLHIAQQQAQQLALGGAASVKIPGVQDPVTAKVALISPALDPGSTTVEVWLRVENTQGQFKAGTAVHTTITGRTVPNAMLVPTEAIQVDTDGTGRFVTLIAADSTAHKRAVTVGIQTPVDAQILSGLTPGDMVITSGGYGLDDGTKVKIGTDPSAGPDAAATKPNTGDAKPTAGKDADNK